MGVSGQSVTASKDTGSKPSWMQDDSAATSQAKKVPGKAMQLGKPKKQNELMKDLQKEKLYSKP